MPRALFHLALIALPCAACTDKNGGDTSSTDTTTDSTFPAAAELSAELAFEVPERPLDLAVSPDGRIFCSAQAGGKVYAWDPVSADRDEVYDDFSDVVALVFSGDDLYMTFSDNGVTGGLYRIDGLDAIEVTTQDDLGVLMRDPGDLILDDLGGFLIADDNTGVVFHVASSGAVSSFPAGSTEPLALALVGETLYIGGDDGIWSMSWPGGSPTLIDSRAGLGLLAVGEALWAANASEDLFIVSGGQLGADDAARPASLALSDGVVYFADRVGQGVWAVTP
ncbi:MAG: hypothetical protein ACI8RZ_004036 [Myxococcota bacterium]|jgi:hypothetical protein